MSSAEATGFTLRVLLSRPVAFHLTFGDRHILEAAQTSPLDIPLCLKLGDRQFLEAAQISCTDIPPVPLCRTLRLDIPLVSLCLMFGEHRLFKAVGISSAEAVSFTLMIGSTALKACGPPPDIWQALISGCRADITLFAFLLMFNCHDFLEAEHS